MSLELNLFTRWTVAVAGASEVCGQTGDVERNIRGNQVCKVVTMPTAALPSAHTPAHPSCGVSLQALVGEGRGWGEAVDRFQECVLVKGVRF